MSHASDRAAERYGIELSDRDMNAIANRCLAGEGLLKKKQDGSQFHTIIFRDRVLHLVYQPPGPGNRSAHPCGAVVTIVPKEVVASYTYHDRRHILRRLKDRPRRNK